jgi:LacI family transcriptional regulator
MKEIAQIHGVSINAVSLALNNKPGVSEEMRIKILRSAEKMGYLEEHEKFIRTFERTNLCVMIQKKYSQDMNFYGRVLYSVVEEAKKNGYDASMNFFDDKDMEIPKMIEEHRVCGIIIIGKISDGNIDLLEKYKIPMVLVDHASLIKNIDSILTDNKLGGFVITKYLIEKGFKKIGFFGELTYSLSIKERYWGYREALSNLGNMGDGYYLNDYVERYSITEGIEEAVLSNDNKKIVELVQNQMQIPEVFVCSNDKAAIALMMVLQTLGYRIPEDISIVGFDDIDICEKIYPKLTTIHVNKEIMGKRGIERLIYRIGHKNSLSENIVIGVELVERETVKSFKELF